MQLHLSIPENERPAAGKGIFHAVQGSLKVDSLNAVQGSLKVDSLNAVQGSLKVDSLNVQRKRIDP